MKKYIIYILMIIGLLLNIYLCGDLVIDKNYSDEVDIMISLTFLFNVYMFYLSYRYISSKHKLENTNNSDSVETFISDVTENVYLYTKRKKLEQELKIKDLEKKVKED